MLSSSPPPPELTSTFATLQFETDYVVTYVFNGKPIENRIHSKLTVSTESGLIVRQEDSFDFYGWTRQSLGVAGLLLGWTSLVQGQVQTRAKASLDAFLEKEGQSKL